MWQVQYLFDKELDPEFYAKENEKESGNGEKQVCIENSEVVSNKKRRIRRNEFL